MDNPYVTPDSERILWEVAKKHITWVHMAHGEMEARFHDPTDNGRTMTYGRLVRSRRPGTLYFHTTDGHTFTKMKNAKTHELETEVKPRLIYDGYVLSFALHPELPRPNAYRDGSKFYALELEIEQLPLLGHVTIESLGNENIYLSKGGLHFYCKVGGPHEFCDRRYNYAAQVFTEE